MIKIEADKRGGFKIFPSDKSSPAQRWLARLAKDPLFIGIESERLLSQDPSNEHEVNEDWRQYAEDEILLTAMKWHQEFCSRSGVLKFTRSDISHLAAFLNRSRLKIIEISRKEPDDAESQSDLTALYEFLTFLLEVVVGLEREFSN